MTKYIPVIITKGIYDTLIGGTDEITRDGKGWIDSTETMVWPGGGGGGA